VSVPKYYVAQAMEILKRRHGHGVEPAGALALAGSLWYEATQPRSSTDPKRTHITVTSGANVTEATEAHFSAVLSEHRREETAARSSEHLTRSHYGVDEILRRTAGQAATGHSRMFSGW
jgi:threonine dehydratase